MDKYICVFCSSSNEIDAAHFEAAKVFAKDAVTRGYTIVCGGGSCGLMGQIARTAVENNGKAIGIMPEFMKKIEWESKDLSRLVVVEDMRERKKKMMENAEAVVALAGGCGTLDELMEAITLKHLGIFEKPIIILNTNGFYDHLKLFMQKMYAEKFMDKKSLKMFTFVDKPDKILMEIYK